MEKLAHWTQRSVADFVYNISSNFVAQLETRMEEKEISRSELAARMNKSNGRVSQVFNNPGNLSLRVIVEYARTLDMKVSIVAYDDGDPDNKNGPINPEVFVKSWEKANRPLDLFEVAGADAKQPDMNWQYAYGWYKSLELVHVKILTTPHIQVGWVGNPVGEPMDSALYSVTGCSALPANAQPSKAQILPWPQGIPTTQELTQ